jgi:hypothetical protein
MDSFPRLQRLPAAASRQVSRSRTRVCRASAYGEVREITSGDTERSDVAVMSQTFIDPHTEAPALRRAAVLLERVRQDGGGSEIAELEASVATMRRAAAAGRLVHHSALDRMSAVLARIAPQPCGRGTSVGEIVRCNALTETRELLLRLSRPKPPREAARLSTSQMAGSHRSV